MSIQIETEALPVFDYYFCSSKQQSVQGNGNGFVMGPKQTQIALHVYVCEEKWMLIWFNYRKNSLCKKHSNEEDSK